MNTPKTDIHVRLVGEDGNIFFILGRVREALRRGADLRRGRHHVGQYGALGDEWSTKGGGIL